MKFRFLTLAALCGISASAFAAAPHPTAIDADRDGAFVATSDINSDGAVDHLDIGVRARQYDCDDAHSTVSPRLAEVVGDGIDNDCSGADANWPAGVTDTIAARFIANSGTKSPVAFIAEYDACNASAECEVDTVAGTFAITAAAAETHKFADIYVNGSKVLRNNGQRPDGREVVTVEEFEHFRGGSASGSGSYTGPSRATREKEALAVATPLVTAEAEARLSADAVHDRRIGQIETGNAGRDVELNRLGDVDSVLKMQIAEETTIRLEIDETLETLIDTAQGDATDALSHGPLLEAYAIGGVMIGTPVNDDGDVARNSFGGGAGGGLNFGLDGDGYRVNGFADIVVGADGGSGPAHSEAVGAEATFALDGSDVHLGPFAAYSQRSTQVNALESQVVGRNPLVGISLAAPFAPNGAAHGLFQARIGCGPEFIGMAGDSVTSGTGVGCRATIGIGGGVGALQ